MNVRPHVLVFAGPNGAGKSTCASRLMRELGLAEYVNPELIAHGLGLREVDFLAGRVMWARLKQLATQRRDFAFETTLAARSYYPWLTALRHNGYIVDFVYLWLSNPKLAVERVAERVRMGGHDVPEEAIRRRYARSLTNFFRLYQACADRWFFYNNSNLDLRLIASGKCRNEDTVADPTI